ncbi:MAG: Hsp20/alpha crystallin family protein [Pseudomonadales bacterium]|nr:Hsp20/alpha crystallin family protein [Pseudomonadales bacterium]
MSTLIRWNPIREMAGMQSAIDRLFENTWREMQPGWNGNLLPIDVQENESAYTVVTNLPGLTPDQIDVNIHENILTVSGEVQKVENKDDKTRNLIQERVYGKFSRSINLPQTIDVEHVEASYDNGVLTLTLPKLPSAQPRQIEIKSANLIKSQN